MNKVRIRKATADDVPSMVELLKQLFSIEEDFTFNSEKQAQGLQLLIVNESIAHILVAEHNGKVIGMLSAQFSISTAEGCACIVLEDMVVDKAFRRKGVGKQLMQSMENWAKNKRVPRMQLLADHTNSIALDYYKKMGWQTTNMFCLRKYL